MCGTTTTTTTTTTTNDSLVNNNTSPDKEEEKPTLLLLSSSSSSTESVIKPSKELELEQEQEQINDNENNENDDDSNSNNNAGTNNTNRQLLQMIRRKAKHFFENEFSFWYLIDPTRSWIVVDNEGSFLDGFHWVPIEFRTGPWNIIVCMFLAACVYAVGLSCIYVWFVVQVQPTSTHITTSNNNLLLLLDPDIVATTEGTSTAPPDLMYFPLYSNQWWFNLLGFAWTTFVTLSIIYRGAGYASWMTFTVQSWTLIHLRFGLAVLSPLCPSTGILQVLAEALRLPMLGQATITFLAWNLILGPLLLVLISNNSPTSHRKKFIEIFTNFRLCQLHIFNIVLATTQGLWGSPARPLTDNDLCLALLGITAYAMFYLGLLDRLGIHLYFVYSPRTILAILTWSLTYLAMYFSYRGWGYLILQYGVTTTTNFSNKGEGGSVINPVLVDTGI